MGHSRQAHPADARTFEAAAKAQRRHDLDWLRVIGVFTLIPLHSAVIFSLGLHYLKQPQPSLALDTIVVYISIWLMPLLFFLAGAAARFALNRRTPRQFIRARAKRLMVPFSLFFALPLVAGTVFGWSFLFQVPTYGSVSWEAIGTGHLWFINYLFWFSLVALPVFIFLRKPAGQRLISRLAAFCEKPGMIFILAIPLMLRPPDNDNPIVRIFYIVYFIYGFVIFSDPRVGAAIEKHAGIGLALGLAGLIGYMIVVETNNVPQGITLSTAPLLIVTGITPWAWLVAILGFGRRYLSFENGTLRYLAEASYPIYILHMPVNILVGYYVLGTNWDVLVKFGVIVVSTIFLTVAAYDLLVKRTKVTRYLFGMKPKRPTTPPEQIEAKPAVAT
jgi:glucans biosynthesis protein C